MDVPAAICETADFKMAVPARVGERGAATRAQLDQMLFFRVGDDLVSFPVAYAPVVPVPARIGCVLDTRELSFTFWASDMAPPDADMLRPVSFFDTPPVGSGRPAGDFLVTVTRLYYGAHANWLNTSTTIGHMRRNGTPRGMLYGLENFSSGPYQFLIRLSEDCTVLVQFSNSTEWADRPASMNFQNSAWSAGALVRARFADRWDAVYNAIDAFVAKHMVKNYFKK